MVNLKKRRTVLQTTRLDTLSSKLTANTLVYGAIATGGAPILANIEHPFLSTLAYAGVGAIVYGTRNIAKKIAVNPLAKQISKANKKRGALKTYGTIAALGAASVQFAPPVKNAVGYYAQTIDDVLTLGGERQSQIDFTKQWEGFRSKVYDDSEGYETIGWGTLIDPKKVSPDSPVFQKAGLTVADVNAYRAGKPMSEELAEKLIEIELESCEEKAPQLVKNYNMLPNDAKLIVVDMIYNLGSAGFSDFEDTIHALEWRDWDGVAKHLEDSKWYAQTKRRAHDHVATFEGLHTEQWYMRLQYY